MVTLSQITILKKIAEKKLTGKILKDFISDNEFVAATIVEYIWKYSSKRKVKVAYDILE